MSKKIKNLIKYGGLHPENEFTRLIQRQKALNKQEALKRLHSEIVYGPPRPPKWTERAYTPYTRQDGLYVDVSHRNGIMFLGFAHVNGQFIQYMSTTSRFKGTTEAEKEAVEIAKRLMSEVTIYCDEIKAVESGAVYVSRNRNPAHQAARQRKGFVDRIELDSFLNDRE